MTDAGGRPLDELRALWEEHLRAPYPPGFRGVNIAGAELILLDADIAGVVLRELTEVLDHEDLAILWWCVAQLDKALPSIRDAYCARYFGRLRAMAGVVARAYLPEAT